MSLLDLHNEFFRPLWIRVLLLCILFGWSLLEFSTGAPFWGVVFGGIGLVAVWQWFIGDWPEAAGENSASQADVNGKNGGGKN